MQITPTLVSIMDQKPELTSTVRAVSYLQILLLWKGNLQVMSGLSAPLSVNVRIMLVNVTLYSVSE